MRFVSADGIALLMQDDCLAALKTLESDSVDSVVTDPPYGLAFMGKRWDYDVPGEDVWRECLRVLKPGGHLLAFAGTRTQHRMAVRIEDAGFEIRDMIAWVYGSGFPKSLDVSKAIDKAGGASPSEQSEMLRARRQAAGLSREQVAEAVGCTPSSVRDWEEGRARATGAAVEFIVPSNDYRMKLADLLGYSADERLLVGVAADRRGDGTGYGLGHSGELRVGGNTNAARQWQGWGTALKPAIEPITVARKPLIGTVAENVLLHGTGAINVDGCRIKPQGDGDYSHTGNDLEHTRKGREDWRMPSQQAKPNAIGRWPANLIHDGSEEPTGPLGDAARFFYCAKASKRDRGEGNAHPTVKPTDLMRYLCRLVTPPGGVVLDPFMGSGSTGKAAMLEGFRFVGVEKDAHYFEIAFKRIRSAEQGANPDG